MVQLGAHGFQPFPGDAVGLALRRGNQPAPPEACEQCEVAGDQVMSVTREAEDLGDAAFGVTFVTDTVTLGERVQDALLRFGDVQVGCS